MIAYKVVRVNEEGQRESVVIHEGKYKVNYTLGVPVVGLNGTPIFAFDTLDKALEMCSDCGGDGQVWLCKGEPMDMPSRILPFYIGIDDSLIDKFWEGSYTGSHISPPLGTIGLKNCTLWERLA